MITQRDQILEHLEKGLPITPLEALDKFRCMRLAAVVKELRYLGYGVETEMISNGNKRYARYKMPQKAQKEFRF